MSYPGKESSRVDDSIPTSSQYSEEALRHERDQGARGRGLGPGLCTTAQRVANEGIVAAFLARSSPVRHTRFRAALHG